MRHATRPSSPSSSFGTPISNRKAPGASIPLIYGSNVSMESPDPMSKFHDGPGGMRLASPSIGTPVNNRKAPGASIPLIYGSNVSMESPDPMSKFHDGPGGLQLAADVPREDDTSDYGSLSKSQNRVLRNLQNSMQNEPDVVGAVTTTKSSLSKSWTEDLIHSVTAVDDKENQPFHENNHVAIVRHHQPRPPMQKPPSAEGGSKRFRRPRRGMAPNVTMASSSVDDEMSQPPREPAGLLVPAEPIGHMEPMERELEPLISTADIMPIKPKAPLEKLAPMKKNEAEVRVSPTSIASMDNEMYYDEDGEPEGPAPDKRGKLIDDLAADDDTYTHVDEEKRHNNETDCKSEMRDAWAFSSARPADSYCDAKEDFARVNSASEDVADYKEDQVDAKEKLESSSLYPPLPGQERLVPSTPPREKKLCPRAQRPQGRRRRCRYKVPTTESKLDVICEDVLYEKEEIEAPVDTMPRREWCSGGTVDPYRQWMLDQCHSTGTLEVFSTLYEKDFKRFKSLLSMYEDEDAVFPVDEEKNTLLMTAAFLGFRKVARYLIRKGVNVNAQNTHGNTALHFAREQNHFSIVDMLEKKGANGIIENTHGNTFYDRVLIS